MPSILLLDERPGVPTEIDARGFHDGRGLRNPREFIRAHLSPQEAQRRVRSNTLRYEQLESGPWRLVPSTTAMQLHGASRHVLRELFRRDLTGALYMAANLEPRVFEQCRWLVDRDDPASAAVMVFLGLETPALLAFGRDEAVPEIVDRHAADLPAKCYAKLSPVQRQAFENIYRFSQFREMDVMMLNELIAPPPLADVVVREIPSADPLSPILELYRDYPGNFFEPSQLAVGRYAGAWLHGRLVSIAGTHVYAPGERIAVIGNVATAADARGNGLATAVTAFLCGRLRASGCAHVGLHVEHENLPAIAAYRRCGFVKAGSTTEMLSSKFGERSLNS